MQHHLNLPDTAGDGPNLPARWLKGEGEAVFAAATFVPASRATGSGGEEAVQPEQIFRFSAPARRPASPLARRLAAERGIPLSAIAGSGPAGRVLKLDVLTCAAHVPEPPASQTYAAAPVPRSHDRAGLPPHHGSAAGDSLHLTSTLALRPTLLLIDAINAASPRPVSLSGLIARAAGLATDKSLRPAADALAIDVERLDDAMRRIVLQRPHRRSAADLTAALLAVDAAPADAPCVLRVVDLTGARVSEALVISARARLPLLTLSVRAPSFAETDDTAPSLRIGLTVPPDSWPLPTTLRWIAAFEALFENPLGIVA